MKPLVIVFAILGLVFLVLAFLYFTKSAADLPGFLPGHETGAGADKHMHTKHGIGAVVLAIGCFVFAWFQSGAKTKA